MAVLENVSLSKAAMSQYVTSEAWGLGCLGILYVPFFRFRGPTRKPRSQMFARICKVAMCKTLPLRLGGGWGI